MKTNTIAGTLFLAGLALLSVAAFMLGTVQGIVSVGVNLIVIAVLISASKE